jgi:hypothetical protein
MFSTVYIQCSRSRVVAQNSKPFSLIAVCVAPPLLCGAYRPHLQLMGRAHPPPFRIHAAVPQPCARLHYVMSCHACAVPCQWSRGPTTHAGLVNFFSSAVQSSCMPRTVTVVSICVGVSAFEHADLVTPRVAGLTLSVCVCTGTLYTMYLQYLFC